MDLNGVITSWNWGAQRLFGYTAEETIGKPVTLLIPTDRHDEEPAILDRIRLGERVEHYDTIRQRKDGTLIDISLTISPLRDPEGKIIGASKIARDITGRRRAEEGQRLLLREMDHRVKNLFALASGVVGLSARSATTKEDLSSAVSGRLAALAKAHALTLRPFSATDPSKKNSTTLHALIDTIFRPMTAGRTTAERAWRSADPTFRSPAVRSLVSRCFCMSSRRTRPSTARYRPPMAPSRLTARRTMAASP